MKKAFYWYAAACAVALYSQIFCMESVKKEKSVIKDLAIQSGIGACAGISEVTVDQPLVRLKNMLQQNQSTGEMFKTYNGSSRAILKTLYAGYPVNAGSMAPITAIQVASNYFIKDYLSKGQTKDLVLHEKMSAAFVSGIVSGFASSPAECVIVRQGNTGESLSKAFKSMIKTYGETALYRGYFPIALRDGGFSVGYLVLSGAIADSIPRSLPLPLDNKLFQAFVGGIPAGVLAAVVTHPFDTMSTLMKSDLAREKYPNTMVTFTTIIKTKGVKGLYSGLLPRLLRVTMAIPLMTFVASGLQDLLYSA